MLPPATSQHHHDHRQQQQHPPQQQQSRSAEPRIAHNPEWPGRSGTAEQTGGENGTKRKRNPDGSIIGPDGIAPPLRDPKSGQTISLVSFRCYIWLCKLPRGRTAYHNCLVWQDTPEDIEKWRAERRKRWPSASNIAKKVAEQEQRRARGELPDAEAPRRGGRSDGGRGAGRGRGRGHSADRRVASPLLSRSTDHENKEAVTAGTAAVGWAGMAERWGRGRGGDVRGGRGRGRASRGRGANGRGRQPNGREQNGGPRDASAMQSRQPTLLRKLLRKEQRREYSLVLQLFRHLVQTDFFATPLHSDNINDKHIQEGEVVPAGLSRLPPAASLVPAYQAMLAAFGVDDDESDDDTADGNCLGLGSIPNAGEVPCLAERLQCHGAASSDSARASNTVKDSNGGHVVPIPI